MLVRKDIQGEEIGCDPVVGLKRMVREGLWKEVSLEQRPEGSEGAGRLKKCSL